MRMTSLRSRVGVPVACAFLLAACADRGTKLGALPPVELAVYLPITAGIPSAPLDTGFGSAQVILVSTDPARCPTLSSETVAKINARPLDLIDEGELSATKSGTPQCGTAEYYGDSVPLGGDATITLRDDTATFRIVAVGALEPAPGTVTVVSSAEGIMHLGGVVQIGIPANGRAVRSALISFIPDGASASSFTAATQGAGNVPVSVSGDVVSFTVPTASVGATIGTGHGTLFATLQFEDQVTTCDGPAACHVFTEMVETVPATLLN